MVIRHKCNPILFRLKASQNWYSIKFLCTDFVFKINDRLNNLNSLYPFIWKHYETNSTLTNYKSIITKTQYIWGSKFSIDVEGEFRELTSCNIYEEFEFGLNLDFLEQLVYSRPWRFYKYSSYFNLVNKKKKILANLLFKSRWPWRPFKFQNLNILKVEFLEFFNSYLFRFYNNLPNLPTFIYLFIIYNNWLKLLAQITLKWNLIYSLIKPVNFNFNFKILITKTLLNESKLKIISQTKLLNNSIKLFIISKRVNIWKSRSLLMYNFWKHMLYIWFFWRSKFFINLVVVYNTVLTTPKLEFTSKTLVNYLSVQMRIIFSKLEQKYLLYFLLTFNKILIKESDWIGFNMLNQLVILHIIIRGRWQRKRWVRPFPKKYTIGNLKFFKLFKKYTKTEYYLSLSNKQIFTRKGTIHIWIFLFFKLNKYISNYHSWLPKSKL